MSVTKIEAWKTSYDGKVFDNKEDAIAHDTRTNEMFNRNESFYEHINWIIEYIVKNFREGDYDKDELDNQPYFLPHGWKCDNKDNPIDKCIYSPALYLGDDCCVFCRNPEERK